MQGHLLAAIVGDAESLLRFDAVQHAGRGAACSTPFAKLATAPAHTSPVFLPLASAAPTAASVEFHACRAAHHQTCNVASSIRPYFPRKVSFLSASSNRAEFNSSSRRVCSTVQRRISFLMSSAVPLYLGVESFSISSSSATRSSSPKIRLRGCRSLEMWPRIVLMLSASQVLGLCRNREVKALARKSAGASQSDVSECHNMRSMQGITRKFIHVLKASAVSARPTSCNCLDPRLDSPRGIALSSCNRCFGTLILGARVCSPPSAFLCSNSLR